MSEKMVGCENGELYFISATLPQPFLAKLIAVRAALFPICAHASLEYTLQETEFSIPLPPSFLNVEHVLPIPVLFLWGCTIVVIVPKELEHNMAVLFRINKDMIVTLVTSPNSIFWI